VRQRREQQGLSQRQIAAPVSNANISRIESEARELSEKALRALAEKLGMTAHYLESGSERGRCPHCGK
jgi:transcriptional regulator with XRE-family HTH domain